MNSFDNFKSKITSVHAKSSKVSGKPKDIILGNTVKKNNIDITSSYGDKKPKLKAKGL